MRVAGVNVNNSCRLVSVRNHGTAFLPKWVWKCACGAHGTRKDEAKAQEALDKHIKATEVTEDCCGACDAGLPCECDYSVRGSP